MTMAVRKVTAFAAEDGTLFLDETEAAKHDAALKLKKWADQRGLADEGRNADALFDLMIQDHSEMHRIFAAIERASPPAPAVPAKGTSKESFAGEGAFG